MDEVKHHNETTRILFDKASNMFYCTRCGYDGLTVILQEVSTMW